MVPRASCSFVSRRQIIHQMLEKLFVYVIIILSVTAHEYAHAFVAYESGDPSAKKAGRLTLNPLAHLDPIGTVLIPLVLLFTSGILLGWAKPVPYDPRFLRGGTKDEVKVALAGPAANLSIAFIVMLMVGLLPEGLVAGKSLLSYVVFVNIFLAVFNMIPVPPLDGSKLVYPFLSFRGRYTFESLGLAGIFIAIIIASMILPTVVGWIFGAFSLTVGLIRSIFY